MYIIDKIYKIGHIQNLAIHYTLLVSIEEKRLCWRKLMTWKKTPSELIEFLDKNLSNLGLIYLYRQYK